MRMSSGQVHRLCNFFAVIQLTFKVFSEDLNDRCNYDNKRTLFSNFMFAGRFGHGNGCIGRA